MSLRDINPEGKVTKKKIALQTKWILPAAIALLVIAGGVFAAARFLKSRVSSSQVKNPTVHFAELQKTSDGQRHWTFGCLGNADTALMDLDCREITIAVENRILPYNYIFLNTNQPGGMDYDMWWEICIRLHCQPVFVEVTWEDLLTKISTGEYDAASEGITITDERKKTLDFSDSYLNIEQRLVVRKGETRFTNITDFVANPDLLIGALDDSTNLEAAKLYVPESRIRTFKEYSTVFYTLTTGDVDAAVADQVEGETTVSGIDFQQAINLEFIGNSLSSDQFGVVFPKGSELVEPVNEALHDIRAQGALEELVARYFGSDFNVTYRDIGLGAYGQ